MSDESPEISQGVLEDLADEEGVRKLIECPICLEIPLPPIYLCAKGHIVCNSCQSRTYACPLCRERYSNTRSFVAEGIVEKCNLRCRYSEGGCKVSMKGSDLAEHLNVCEFRPVQCRECDKPINYMEYEKHLFKDHKLAGTCATEAYVAYRINLNFMLQRSFVDSCFWPQYYIKAFDKIFLLRLNVHQFSINPYICLLGEQSDCEKYTALIEYEPNNDGSICHSWKGPVNHFRDEPLEVIVQGRALSVPMDTIMESGAISSDRAEWIYHVVLSEKLPTPASTASGSVEDQVSQTLPETNTASAELNKTTEKSCTRKDPEPEVSSLTSISSPSSGDQPSVSLLSRASVGIPKSLVSSDRRSPTSATRTNSVGIRQFDRRPQCTIQPFIRRVLTGNPRLVESAGTNGDVEDSDGDEEWDL